MLTAGKKTKIRRSGGTFAIIASRYNARYVDAMVRAAQRELKKAGAKTIRVIRVPGAFEIPAVAAGLRGHRLSCSRWLAGHAPLNRFCC